MSTPNDPSTNDAFAPTQAAAVEPAPAAAAALPSGMERLVEQIAREVLVERRRERRWKLALRIVWLLFVLAVAYALFAARGAATAPSGPHTALVELRGEISSDSEASAEVLMSGLKSAFEDAGARAVVLRINSPGGSPVQAGILHDEILRLKGMHQKKVYAVVEEAAASAAYYVAVAADEIYVDKASIVGSIGVLMDGFGATGTLEKLGIERRLLTSGANKGIGDPFSPMSEQHRAYLQATLEQIHRQFIEVVKKGRGERLKESADTFSGLFWNGEQAVSLGLVDGLGSLDYVAREIVKAEEVIDYTPKENVAERLAKRFGASIGAGAVRALRGSLPTIQ